MKDFAPLLHAMRPRQWTKNAVVAAAFFFAAGDPTLHVGGAMAWQTILAVLLFCLLSSGVYLINDVRDAPSDRQHPVKRFRPVASGALSPGMALAAATVLLLLGLGGAFALAREYGKVAAGYVALQLAYSLALKHISLLDVFIIAAGFVLRAIAGAAAIAVPVSPWLLLCAFLLALFLALCKRRHELVAMREEAHTSRPTLEKYDEKLLDQLIAIVSAATIVSYALYTLWPETVHKFNTQKLGLTIPFVIFGIFRYLDLVYRHRKGEQPEQILLTDFPLLANLVLYGASVLAILLGPY